MTNILLMIFYIFTSSLVANVMQNESGFILLIFQVVIFTLIGYNHLKKSDYKHIKNKIIGQSYLPISQRKTYVEVRHWVLLILLYSASDIFSDYLNNTLFYISQFLVFILAFIIVYPLIIESNIGFKKTGIVKIVLISLVSYIVSFGFDYVYELIISVFNLIPMMDL